jgi:hypothetical protein
LTKDEFLGEMQDTAVVCIDGEHHVIRQRKSFSIGAKL